MLSLAAAAHPEPSAFAPVYDLLVANCGNCHRSGGASSWRVDVAPETDVYPSCLRIADAATRARCTTHLQLTEVPGPDIPAWIRPDEADRSEPYVQACSEDESYHVGISLPSVLPQPDCAAFLVWIEAGARP